MKTTRGGVAAVMAVLGLAPESFVWAQQQGATVSTSLQGAGTGNVIEAAREQAALEPVTPKTIPFFTFDPPTRRARTGCYRVTHLLGRSIRSHR
jgi:hypothetical protein